MGPILRTGACVLGTILATALATANLRTAGLAGQESTTRPSRAQTASAAPVGAARAERVRRIDSFLESYVTENRVAGVVALVLREGRTVYSKALGWRDKEAAAPVRTDTIFRIASQSKALTSASIMMLVEEGKIALSDPVSRFIPGFAKSTVMERADAPPVPAKRQIQIKDLLTHTSGLSYGTETRVAALYEAQGLGPAAGNGWYTADKSEPICTSMERLAALPLVSHPGDAYVYGYSIDVLGCVVERASGIALDRFIRTRLTEPLGMVDTAFYLPPAQWDRLAVVYSSGPDGRIVRAPEGSKGQGAYVDGPRLSFSGGAGLLSTAGDYARFLEMIRRGGVTATGQRLLGSRAVGLMTTNQIGSIRGTNGLGYGYGFETTDRFGAKDMDAVGAYGWGGAYGSVYRVDPTSGMIIVLMFNQMPNSTDLGSKFPTVAYSAFADLP